MSDQQFREFVDNQFRAHEQQFRAGEKQFQQLHDALEANTALTQANTAMTEKVAESTAEIVAAFSVTKRGVSFFSSVGKWMNKIARWAAPIITVAGVLWAIKHGQWPKGGE